ncbi:UNVERIFIED_CONTAM: hypothetical protein HDU68_001067, partial [Siphonaria sp. JEL0065]
TSQQCDQDTSASPLGPGPITDSTVPIEADTHFQNMELRLHESMMETLNTQLSGMFSNLHALINFAVLSAITSASAPTTAATAPVVTVDPTVSIRSTVYNAATANSMTYFKMPSIRPIEFTGNFRNKPAHELQNILDDYFDRSYELCKLYNFASSTTTVSQITKSVLTKLTPTKLPSEPSMVISNGLSCHLDSPTRLPSSKEPSAAYFKMQSTLSSPFSLMIPTIQNHCHLQL